MICGLWMRLTRLKKSIFIFSHWIWSVISISSMISYDKFVDSFKYNICLKDAWRVEWTMTETSQQIIPIFLTTPGTLDNFSDETYCVFACKELVFIPNLCISYVDLQNRTPWMRQKNQKKAMINAKVKRPFIISFCASNVWFSRHDKFSICLPMLLHKEYFPSLHELDQ